MKCYRRNDNPFIKFTKNNAIKSSKIIKFNKNIFFNLMRKTTLNYITFLGAR